MKKPANYWKNFYNLKKELSPLIKKLGRFPSYRELKKEGLESLSRNGVMHFGGAIKVAKRLKLKTYDQSIGRAAANHWNLENLIKEINTVIKQYNLKFFPTKGFLNKIERLDLLGAIQTIGRKKIIRDKRLKVPKTKVKNKIIFKMPPRDKIWSEKKILLELKKIIKKTGYFPGDLDKIGKSDLRGAIERFGGKLKFWRILNKPIYKKNISNRKTLSSKQIESKYKILISKLKHAPSNTELKKMGMQNLLYDINKNYRSVTNLCKKMNISENLFGMYKTLSGNYVRSINEAIVDNTLSFLKIPTSYEGIISKRYIKNLKYDFKTKDIKGNDVYIEVWGYPEDATRSGVFLNLINNYQNKKKEKIKLYKKNNLTLLEIDGSKISGGSIKNTFNYLTKRFKIYNLISKIPKIKTYDEISLICYKIYDLKLFEKNLRKIHNEYGFFPSASILNKNGHSVIVDRILKLGGFPIIRKKFNFKKKKIEHLWNKKKILRELKILIKKYGHVPKHSQFIKEKKLDLFGAIQQHYGGTRNLAKIYKFKHTNLTTFMDFDTLEKIKKTLLPLLTKEKKIPSQPVLEKQAPPGLISAIKKFGGRDTIGMKLDLELVFPPYKKKKYLLWKLNKLFKYKKNMPQPKEFRNEIKKKEGTDFRIYIYKLGGFKKVANMFNLKYKDSKNAIGNYTRYNI